MKKPINMAEYDLKELEKIRQNKDVLDYLEQHGILEIKNLTMSMTMKKSSMIYR
ncbi:hypothetical protein KUH03_36875 [Sphingobacterium sp. E70]|uniref:hypothetical protein n=1 Tax=Sphingobacterium sp. E70 TaxID=2853439 RepID=UPI00211B8FA1|nr:hypothetical protein [Sphingobacterium sp. E70]ULT24485.1 hypothetical protein KUH03_36875 [Sphingobacterium sp. E70]